MKKYLFISALFIGSLSASAQSADNKFGIAAGAYIQHYNGNLGNSFFKFNTTCFEGGGITLGMWLNKSFDANTSITIGDYGYCQTNADKNRVVALGLRCPGCKDRLGMGELRSRMYSGNLAIVYKFANGYILKEDSKFSPYVYAGLGMNYLEDNMGRNCVNTGNHLTVNGGTGIKYNITRRFNFGYNLALGCFISDKVYATNAGTTDSSVNDADIIKMQKRKDFYMQNSLFLGINF